jgi:hypothetical protein
MSEARPFHDINHVPRPAYTAREARRMIAVNQEARRGIELAFMPCWWPHVVWRSDRGGCYSPDPKDKHYIDGQFAFVHPYNKPRLRRQMARKNGRRRASRVPLMGWFWWTPGRLHFPTS